jgi:hypothetical protein
MSCRQAADVEATLPNEVIEAGVAAYLDFLGDSAPVQMPEGDRELVEVIFRAMTAAAQRCATRA